MTRNALHAQSVRKPEEQPIFRHLLMLVPSSGPGAYDSKKQAEERRLGSCALTTERGEEGCAAKIRGWFLSPALLKQLPTD